MPISAPFKTRIFQQLKNIFFLSLVLSSCTIPRHYQKDKPFVVENKFEVKGGKFTKEEVAALKSRFNAQLEDSSKINRVDKYFIRHVYNKPPAFDTVATRKSAENMRTSMMHLGYFRAKAYFQADTNIVNHQKRVTVKYTVEPGKPTLIDTFSYKLKNAELQEIALKSSNKSLIKEGEPVSKAAVLGEISRLVDIFRDSGFYRFTAEELKMRGDTSLAILTDISDDLFETIRLLAEAQQKMDSPKIKLQLVLNIPSDTNKLKKYYINNIYILPDYNRLDSLNDPTLQERVTGTNRNLLNDSANKRSNKRYRNRSTNSMYIIKFHDKLFRTGFLTRNMYLKKGDLYNQTNFYKTLNSFSRTGVWQSTNIDVIEVKEKDSVNKLNLYVQLIPVKQFAFEAAIEASYSATSNTNSVTAANAGNLVGLSGNVGLTNRNLGKEGIKMTNAIRAGVEFNLKPDSSNTRSVINSNELSYSLGIVIPRFIFPLKKFNKDKHVASSETFFNINASYINRIKLFDLQSTNFSFGYTMRNRKNAQFIFKLLNIEFTRLFNASSDFLTTLDQNPFLKYSFNTSLVAGFGLGYNNTHTSVKHPNRQHTIKANFEFSGIPMFEKYLRRYEKIDAEYTFSKSKPKSAFVLRVFGGVGIANKKDTTLPFFKQYYGGGSNSMRGWPIRGIGRGSQPLTPYGSNKFNDRTGDIQLEINPEYRFNIAQLIPNTLVLKGALFADIGNVWNLRNSKPGGGADSAQFKFKNLWKETGIDLGTGLRLDFNYFVVRFDFGFRFKRPELSDINNGWKIPSIGFDDALKKIFSKGLNEEYRRWRYENFNFTIGINYPF